MNRYEASPAHSVRGSRGIRVALDCAVTKLDMSSQIAICLGGARSLLLAVIGAAVFSLAACGTAHAAQAKPAVPAGMPAGCPWLNPHLPIATRVAMIMRKMTIGEEIWLVAGHGTRPYVGNIAGIPALCIPPLGLEDGPNGVGDGLTLVTNLPSGASVAATFSRKLAYEYGQVIGAEQAAKGSAVDLGPTVNIDRDPRWGREFESLSEDPRLAADLGVAAIRGIQIQGTMAQVKHFDAYNQETYRNTPKDDVIVGQRALHEIYMPAFRAAIRKAKVGSIMCSYATVNGYYSCQNHYLLTGVLRDEWNFDGFVTSDWGAVHNISAAEAGTNMEEPGNRFFGLPLEHAVTQGTISRAVLNTMVEPILYEMFRFNFYNHPPSGSILKVATTPAHQAISTRIAEAGTVLLKNKGQLLPLGTSAKIAVIGPAASTQVTYGGGGSAHVIPSSTVTPLAGIEAVMGTPNVSYTQGLPNNAQLTTIPGADLSTPASGTNRGSSYSATLTAPETGTYILGLGHGHYRRTRLAINGRTLINAPGGSAAATYSAAVHLNKGQAYKVTLACAPSNLVWATPSTVRATIQQAVKAAQSAKVAVVVVADNTESEGFDRPDLRLPSAQNALVSAVAKANPHTVVVIQAGAPIVMPWLDQVAAVLDTWYPGQTNGTALANVLFGKFDPSGHLPVTFPMKLADAPAASPARFPGVNGKVHYSEGLLVGYRWYDAKQIKPMFPFGFGLSYTRFRYSDLHLSQSEVDGVTPIQVSARVTNIGHVAGADVAQLYLGMPASTGEPPRKLVAFQRVALAPGQSQVVHFTITPRDEWWWGQSGWTETAGAYQVYVGDSSALVNLPLTASYRMETAIGSRQVTVSAPKTFKPGTSTVVRVSLSAGGNETLHGVHLSLQAPGGWRVAPLDGTTRNELAPNAMAAAKFAVTPPTGAVTQYVTLYGTADLSQGACLGGDTHADANGAGGSRRHEGGSASARHRRAMGTGGTRCGSVRRDGGETVLLGPLTDPAARQPVSSRSVRQ